MSPQNERFDVLLWCSENVEWTIVGILTLTSSLPVPMILRQILLGIVVLYLALYALSKVGTVAVFLLPLAVWLFKPGMHGLRLMRVIGVKKLALLGGAKTALIGGSWHFDAWTAFLIAESVFVVVIAAWYVPGLIRKIQAQPKPSEATA